MMGRYPVLCHSSKDFSSLALMVHAFTIDVEDYHNVMARDWLGIDGPPTPRVVENMNRFLEWLSDRSVRATCFVLGEVAETFPGLIREIADRGHELGVHGYYHRQVFKLDRESFRKEVGDAKRLIERISGQKIRGHRAPAFSIMPNTAWALEVLAEEGFVYDSSIFPIKGKRYGWPGYPLSIQEVRLPNGRTIIEAPMSTVTVFGRRLPVCGGGYVRHFPAAYTRWAMKRVGRERPAIAYFHPYEIESTCGALDTSKVDRAAARNAQRAHAMQLINRRSMEGKIRGLMRQFDFAPLGEVIDHALRTHSA